MEIAQATRPGESHFNVPGQSHRNPGRKRRRIWSDESPNIVDAHDHLIPGHYASSREARGQSKPPLMHVMKYVVPSLLVLVTLKYQAKTDSLFLENPVPLWCFVAATCVYWLIVGAMKQITTLEGKFIKILSHAALASGVLSVLSLVSIFLPYPWSLVPLMIWIPLPVVLAWPNVVYGLLHRGITSVINKVHVWARSGCNLMEVDASSQV